MAGKTHPRVSVVVRAYNEERHIGRLLAGVRQQTVQDVEIVLVDSGSTDSTVEIARKYKAAIVHIDSGEFTFGRSLNLGVGGASGEFIVIASAHVYPVYPDWLEKLLEPFADPEIALAYGKQRGAPHSHFSERQIFRQWFPEHSDFDQPHPYFHNANAAIRRQLWEQHSYDETLTGLEDLAWAGWVMEQGYRLAYVAEAEVIHVHDETSRQVYNRYRREAIALKQIFPTSRFNLWHFFTHCLRYILSDLWQALRQRVFLRNLVAVLWFRWAQYWGTYRGYRYSGRLTPQLRQTFYYSPRILSERRSARPIRPIDYGDLSEPE
jgi:glycosyltransferase involved in cell wall biosynthesis